MDGLPYMQLCTGNVVKLPNYLCLMEQMLLAPLKPLVHACSHNYMDVNVCMF